MLQGTRQIQERIILNCLNWRWIIETTETI